MTTYSITITNPGAETGNTTGWTMLDAGMGATSSDKHSGTYSFDGLAGFGSVAAGMYQIINVDPSHYSLVDDELVQIFVKAWHRTEDTDDVSQLSVTLYSGLNGTGTNLGSNTSANHNGSTWTEITAFLAVPSGTRSIKITATASNGDAQIGQLNLWDDFTAYFDDVGAASLRNQQLGAYAIGQYPSEEARASQVGGQILGAAEESSGLFDVFSTLLGAYALVKGFPDRRDLRAWTFTQDEHDFYVLQLGDTGTIIYDRLTGQWAEWRSPDKPYWRGNDGVGWEGINLACDNLSGKLWKIDPEGRLDYNTDPITSIVTGGMTLRERKVVPCYDAELAVSQGQPPASLEEGAVGFSLRTSDDGGNSWYDHGTIPGEALGDEMLVRWYGLGTMNKPGRIFEITDTGYARRIDGFNVELGNYGG